jgi:hypothetical protein
MLQNKQPYAIQIPGINSFDTTDEDIFFGRENDRKQLAEAVEIEKSMLAVVWAKVLCSKLP